MTGCVYSPRDSHPATHNHYYQNPPKQEQYNQRPLNDAPFYNGGLQPRPQYRPAVDVGQQYYQNPYYTTAPHPINRTVYFVESRY